jgi:pimeloyl-ACP methyl ester carboxylesterase
MENGEEKYVRVSGMDVRYAVRGTGQPLLLLHGFCEFLESWDFNLGPLGEHYQVYTLDLPGHGLSDKPYLDYTIDFFTGFAASFLEAVGVSRAHVIGHSFGGAIAINLAVSFPDKVDHLVLESSFGLSEDITLLHRLCSVPVLAGGERGSAESAGLEDRIGLEFYLPDFAAREIVSRSYLFMRMPEARRVMTNIMRNWVGASGLRPEAVMLGRLSRIKSPTLLIHCEQDGIHPISLSRVAQELIPSARLKVFPSCGHCPHIEKAALFNETVINFLETGRS